MRYDTERDLVVFQLLSDTAEVPLVELYRETGVCPWREIARVAEQCSVYSLSSSSA